MRSQTCLKVRAPVELSAADRRPLRPFGFASGMEAWTQANKNPKVLLICPPALDPKIEKGPVFAEMFKEGLEKSKQLPPLYEAVAKMGGAEFLNAGSVVSTDGVDGLQLTSEAQKKARLCRLVAATCFPS